MDNPTKRPQQAEWAKMVKTRDEYQCVICGSKKKLNAHHIDPVKTHPHLQLDLDNGITLCYECHMEAHEIEGCTLSELRKCKVK